MHCGHRLCDSGFVQPQRPLKKESPYPSSGLLQVPLDVSPNLHRAVKGVAPRAGGGWPHGCASTAVEQSVHSWTTFCMTSARAAGETSTSISLYLIRSSMTVRAISSKSNKNNVNKYHIKTNSSSWKTVRGISSNSRKCSHSITYNLFHAMQTGM
jgi:hypothetical protein